MTSQQVTKVVLTTLTVVTLAVLCVSIWSMLGTLATSPAPSGSAYRPPANPQASPGIQTPDPALQVRVFPARAGKIIDVSANPDFAGLAATRISMAVSNADVADVVAAFELASSLTGPGDFLRNARSREIAPFGLQLKDAPLLEGILQLCTRTGTTIGAFGPGQLTLQVGAADGAIGRWCVAGPFALMLERIETTARLDSAAARPTAIFQGDFLAEPKARVASVSRMVNVDEFTDENGVSLGTITFNGMSKASTTAPVYRLQATCMLAPTRGRKIAKLRGTIPVTVSNKYTTLQEDLGGTAPITREVNGITIEISPMQVDASRSTIKVRYQRGQSDPKQWPQVLAAIADSGPRFMSDGRELRGSTSSTTPNPDERTVTYMITTPAGNSPPQQFILDVPTELHDLRVPFEFSDLTLP